MEIFEKSECVPCHHARLTHGCRKVHLFTKDDFAWERTYVGRRWLPKQFRDSFECGCVKRDMKTQQIYMATRCFRATIGIILVIDAAEKFSNIV